MPTKTYYITTPIYYPSAKPHMGHAYSSIIADFFARFKRIDGFDVNFLTGTDEHGLKIQRAAEKKGLDTLKFCDEISKTFRDLSQTLNLTNTDFIRTTEDRHKKSVQSLWKELEKNDDIYYLNIQGGTPFLMKHFIQKMKLRKLMEIKLLNHLGLQLNGWMKSLIFLDFQNGKNHSLIITKITLTSFLQKQEKMKSLVLLKAV